MKLGVKITIVFVLVLLIVGIVGVQSYLGIQQLIEANRWVIHTHEVREKLETLLSLIKDAETGRRGFVLTGEERYLEPFNSATGEIMKNIEAAASLTRDNPEQQESLQQLQKLSRDKLDELGDTIKLRRRAGMEAALVVIRSDRGKKIMDNIRALLNQMETRESELLDNRNRVARETARRTILITGFGVLLSLMILGIAALIVTDTMRLADRSLVSKDSGRKWVRIAVRYTFAVAMVVLASVVRWWLVRSFGPMPLFITMYPAVVLVSAIAGGGPGVAATLLSALAVDYWFIEPIGQFGIASANEAVSLGFFTGTGIFLSILAERLQRARRSEAVSVTQEKELALLNMGTLMALDLDHRIVRWSEGNRRLYGFEAQEALGRLTYELLHTHFDQPLEQIQRELLENGHWEGEAARLSKDGTQLAVAILWALRRDERGKPLAILEVSTDMTRQKLVEESLQQQAEELAHQNEELSLQSEELAQQSEELSGLNEELQTQSEEIQAMNVELGQREKTLQMLLDSARLPIGEQEVMEKICRLATEMIGFPGAGAVVCEQYGEELEILAHAGFDGADVPASWPLKSSFIEVVMQQNRTACLEDTSLRQDLNILSVPGDQQFSSVLSSPLRVKGRPIGALSIYSNKTQQWTVEQFRLIEWLAAQCSNTLETMRLAAEVLRGRKQNEFLANILEASSQAFGVGYPDGRLGLTNKAFEQLTGYSSEELRSIDWGKTLTPPEWVEIEHQKLDELHRTGLPIRYEKEYIRKDGTRVPIELLVHMVSDEEGKPLYYYSFITDITQRKQAEEVQGRLAAIVETADDAIIGKDLNGIIHTWNVGAETIFGYKAEEVIGKNISILVPPGLADEVPEILSRIKRGQHIEQFETKRMRKDGTIIPVSLIFSAIKDSNGRIIGASKIAHDITDSKLAEEEIKRLNDDLVVRNDKLEFANKELESFIYSVSHDLRGPLRAISGFCEIMMKDIADKLDQKGKRYFARILDGTGKMSRLIDDLLDLSRLSRQEIQRREVNMSTISASIVNELRDTHPGRSVEVDIKEGLTAFADPGLIELALSNLIGNAWKFTAKTEHARIEFGSVEQDGKIIYYVGDNGAGFDQKYAGKMLLPFHRLHSEADFEGTGIGLAIVDRIISRHGGKVWAEGIEGKGATIYFSLS